MAGLDCEILGDRGTDVVRGRARRADTICENDRLATSMAQQMMMNTQPAIRRDSSPPDAIGLSQTAVAGSGDAAIGPGAPTSRIVVDGADGELAWCTAPPTTKASASETNVASTKARATRISGDEPCPDPPCVIDSTVTGTRTRVAAVRGASRDSGGIAGLARTDIMNIIGCEPQGPNGAHLHGSGAACRLVVSGLRSAATAIRAPTMTSGTRRCRCRRTRGRSERPGAASGGRCEQSRCHGAPRFHRRS